MPDANGESPLSGCMLYYSFLLVVHTCTHLIFQILFSLCVVYVPFNSHPCSILEVLRLIVAIQLERRDQRKENIGSTLTGQMEDMSLR